MKTLPDAFATMAAYRQWVVWQAVKSKTRPGKADKFPINIVTGEVCNAHDPQTWVDAQTAINAVAQRPGLGVGFVFTKEDPFFFLDIDECLLPSGQWSDFSKALCGQFPGAAIEVSQSGRGLHVIGTSQPFDHTCKNAEHKIELYTSGRFVALTGDRVVGDAGVDCTSVVAGIITRYFEPRETFNPEAWTSGPRDDWAGPINDDELIEKALNSQSAAAAFGGGVAFRDLWENNEDVLGRRWPDSVQGRAYDASNADAALAQHLAFWTGCDCDRMVRLMMLSGLVRDKWNRADYLPRTITRAVALQKDVYNNTPKSLQQITETPRADVTATVADPMGSSDGPQLVAGLQYLAITQQIEHFAGCVYVQDLHRVFTPTGALLNPERFRATYGGYIFALDAHNDKTTRNAWEAFTESQGLRNLKAEGLCFRPELLTGQIIVESGRRLVNTYVPAQGERVAGDVRPFLAHVSRLVPDGQDQAILLDYMAAVVQQPGVKFQWAPLLQGVEGNGKTFLARALGYAVGMRYVHVPNAADVTNKFNAWLERRLLIILEEVHAAGSDAVDALKVLITNSMIEIQAKGQDQRTGDNCANFFLCSNHKDAVRKTENDRRFAVFYTAQQTVGDFERDGMTPAYFAGLYAWAKDGGFAHVAEYLATREISVDVMGRAPITSSTAEAIRSSLGGIEGIIQNAIEFENEGFRGDFVCTTAACALFEKPPKGPSPQKIATALSSLGYMRHPALEASRGTVKIKGKVHRLYVKRGSLAANLQTAKSVADAFTNAQDTEVASGIRVVSGY